MMLLILGTLLLLMVTDGRAQTAPRTPYRRAPSLEEVQHLRNISDATRKLIDFRASPSGPPGRYFNIAFGYCAGNEAPVAARHVLEGMDDQGASVSVHLADVKSLRVAEHDAVSVKMRVSVLPTLPAAQLLELKPTYSTLLQDHARFLTVLLPKIDKSGRSFCMAGAREPDDALRFICRLADLTPDTDLPLLYDTNKIWWALPSVISDARYPFRMGFDAVGENERVRKPNP